VRSNVSNIGSSSKKGNLANKSYASSEIGGEESHNGDPEYSKDFNSAYHKVDQIKLNFILYV
jgi:hypothetical protein